MKLGPLQIVARGARAANRTQKKISDSKNATAPTTITYDDAAVTIIRYAHLAEISNASLDTDNANITPTPAKKMRDFCIAIIDRLAEMIKLANQIASGRSSAGNLARDMENSAEADGNTAESSGYPVYSDISELLATVRDEIEKINSFEGFFLGVHDKIEKFTMSAKLGLEQILDVEKNMTQQNATSEISVFSVTRVREQALKVLRCQEDLEPEKVLILLKDVRSQGIAERLMEQADAAPGQKVSMQESEKT